MSSPHSNDTINTSATDEWKLVKKKRKTGEESKSTLGGSGLANALHPKAPPYPPGLLAPADMSLQQARMEVMGSNTHDDVELDVDMPESKNGSATSPVGGILHTVGGHTEDIIPSTHSTTA